jgi:hypothetical protein
MRRVLAAAQDWFVRWQPLKSTACNDVGLYRSYSCIQYGGAVMRSFFTRPFRRALLALVAATLVAQGAWAHHGWGWASEEEFELTGKITNVRLGNPHGEVTLDANGEKWLVQVGQPWRNEQAGLTPELLSVGRILTVHGHRSKKESEKLMKAERVIIDGKSYNLYPDRHS